MRYKERQFVDHIQLTLAKLVNADESASVDRFAPVCEAVTNGDYVLAVFFAEQAQLPLEFIRKMRRVFRVRRFA